MPSIDSLMFARSSVFAREDRVMSETLSLFLGADVSDNQGVWTFLGLFPRQRLDGAVRKPKDPSFACTLFFSRVSLYEKTPLNLCRGESFWGSCCLVDCSLRTQTYFWLSFLSAETTAGSTSAFPG